MRERGNTRFRIKINKIWKGSWSFGMCLSHNDDETYLYINLIKVTISIGWLGDY